MKGEDLYDLLMTSYQKHIPGFVATPFLGNPTYYRTAYDEAATKLERVDTPSPSGAAPGDDTLVAIVEGLGSEAADRLYRILNLRGHRINK